MPAHASQPRQTPQRRRHTRWRRALHTARALFEDDGYPTAVLDEIEAIITRVTPSQHAPEVPSANAEATLEPQDATNTPQVQDAAAPYQLKAETPAHRPSQYRIEHYQRSRYWGVYGKADGVEHLIAVTVYRRGAREVVGRLEMHERTIADLKRQLGQLPSLG